MELLDEYKPLKLGYWKWLDFTMGILLGLWVPYAQRARNYDCQYQLGELAFEIIDWYILTDPFWWRGFSDWYSALTVVGNALNQLGLLWAAIDTCAAQYTYSVTNPWL
jgi:hypothetical protein